jgi:hypothetical protein
MKKSFLSFLLLAAFFLLSLASCLDERYNFDDEHLDKSGVFSNDGMSIPLRNIEKFNLVESLVKNYKNDIFVGPDGVLYVEFNGSINVDFPSFDLPEIQEVTSNEDINNLSERQTLPLPAGSKITLVTKEKLIYEIEKPNYKSKDDSWEITIDSIGFKNLKVEIAIKLEGMTISNPQNAKLSLSLDFSSAFILSKEQTRQVVKEINFNELRDGVYVWDDVYLLGCTYNEEEMFLNYNLELSALSNISISATNPEINPSFELILRSKDVEVNNVKCQAKSDQEWIDAIDGFSNFYESFNGNLLEFDNPYFQLNTNTNLGADFDINIHQLRSTGDNNQMSISSPDVLHFEKPAGENVENYVYTDYYLSQKALPFEGIKWKQLDLARLFSIIPKNIDYQISFSVDDKDSHLFYEGMKIETNYKFTAPFSFSKIDLNFRDTVYNIFNEEAYTQFFKYAKGSLALTADIVDISIGEKDQSLATITTKVKILDEKFADTGIQIPEIELKNGQNTNFSITIAKQYLELMQNARHLEFVFELKGGSINQPLQITESDYIFIQGVKFISDSGIHFEL